MNNENYEHCVNIAEEIKRYARGDMYRCPECGEIIEWDNNQYNDEYCTYTCPSCGEVIEESELEALNLYDYFEDSIYNTEWRLDSNREYKSVAFMVACGGPNIWVDTGSGNVELYWWNERASAPIDGETRQAIDDFAEELFQC